LDISVANWAVEEGGNLVHLVYDDSPYLPVHDVSEPVDLGALLAASGVELTAGWHLVRGFLARATHESVKRDGAYDSFAFYYGEAPERVEWDSLAPTLTYSMPQGCFAGEDAERVLLDFYVTNADLGEHGHRVRVSIDGVEVASLDEWVPYHITGLAPGEHRVHLELLDALGQLEVEPFNDAERTITLTAACP
jgi:hypothetical protein